ncbi:hypothetical protein [Aquimarina sp. 2201CG5-10]|uniref:hypothetical protein n=1 Tax=Aquimarina callyspongiae TaxID=3098150 RepID=UPI002AB5C349|nr:hypothetical protein [Aquimarina sp. 2201CG5-10]MDY8137630.1 hypothetical protein [Aquimarina sp. 2201CG5-10]
MKPLVFLLVLLSCLCHAQEEESSPNTYRFRYKSEVYKGTRMHITDQLRTLKNNSWFINIPEEKQIVLTSLFKKVKNQPIPRLYKKNAIIFLDALYSYEDFLHIYDQILYEVMISLKKDMRRLDLKFEKEFIKAKIILDRVKKEELDDQKEINRLSVELRNKQIKLLSHRWMKKKFEKYRGIDAVKKPDELVKEFKKREATNVFRMIEENNIPKINPYLENQIIEFFNKKSLPEIHPDKLELDYIDKI